MKLRFKNAKELSQSCTSRLTKQMLFMGAPRKLEPERWR
jgi:hypothetical protein